MAARLWLTTNLPARNSQPRSEAASPKHGASRRARRGLRGKRRGRRLGDRPIVTKDHVAETPARFRCNLQAERKITVAQGPSAGHGLDRQKPASSCWPLGQPERPQTGRGTSCRLGPPDRVTRYNPPGRGMLARRRGPLMARRGCGRGILPAIVNGPASTCAHARATRWT